MKKILALALMTIGVVACNSGTNPNTQNNVPQQNLQQASNKHYAVINESTTQKLTHDIHPNGVWNEYSPDDHIFYTVIINNSNNKQVSIWAKNDLHWDNWGWCDAGDDGEDKGLGKHPLAVNPGDTKVYCGGTFQSIPRVWTDTPRLQHEWWFKTPDSDWSQNYSEQWLTYQGDNDHGNFTRLAANNDWKNAYDLHPFLTPHVGSYYETRQLTTAEFDAYVYYAGDISDSILPKYKYDREAIREDAKTSLQDGGFYKIANSRLTNNTVVFYEIAEDGKTMAASCYSLPFKFDWHKPETMRQGPNLCPGSRSININ